MAPTPGGWIGGGEGRSGSLHEALRVGPACRNLGSLPVPVQTGPIKGNDPRPALKALGWSAAGMEELLAFRDWLIDRLTAAAAPE
jgi:hypothetical protein